MTQRKLIISLSTTLNNRKILIFKKKFIRIINVFKNRMT